MDLKKLNKYIKILQKKGMRVNAHLPLFNVSSTVFHYWRAGNLTPPEPREAQFEAYYKWVDAGAPGLEEWIAREYEAPIPGNIPVVPIRPRGKKASERTESKTTALVAPARKTSLVNRQTMEMVLDDYIRDANKKAFQHAVAFAAKHCDIPLDKAKSFAVILAVAMQANNNFQGQDISSLLD